MTSHGNEPYIVISSTNWSAILDDKSKLSPGSLCLLFWVAKKISISFVTRRLIMHLEIISWMSFKQKTIMALN